MISPLPHQVEQALQLDVEADVLVDVVRERVLAHPRRQGRCEEVQKEDDDVDHRVDQPRQQAEQDGGEVTLHEPEHLGVWVGVVCACTMHVSMMMQSSYKRVLGYDHDSSVTIIVTVTVTMAR